MSRIMVKRMAFGMTAAFIVGVVSQFAVAQAPSLDARSIRIAALGANEVSKAAITHRSEKKRRRPSPPANARPQTGDSLHEWCPTCCWYQENKGSY
ncbi:MAG: hypothetical protein ACXWKA_03255 [Xanthobacteraceae bacterium]